MKVKLQDIVQEMQMANDSMRSFLNLRTGEIESLYDDMDEEEREEISERLDQDGFVALPESYDIHEYSIMERFAAHVSDPVIQERLADAIDGRGAFQRFKRCIHQYHIEQTWYDFRDAAFRQIAVEWCEENGLEYENEGD